MFDVIDSKFSKATKVEEPVKKTGKECQEQFYAWLFDGKTNSEIPKDVLHYKSPISHSYVIGIFGKYPKAHMFINQYFNKYDTFSLDKVEFFNFIKTIVQQYNVKRNMLTWFPSFIQEDPYIKALKKKIPYLKDSDIKLLEKKLEHDIRFKTMLDESLGFNKKAKKEKVENLDYVPLEESNIQTEQPRKIKHMVIKTEAILNDLEKKVQQKPKCMECPLKESGYTLFDSNVEFIDTSKGIDVLFVGRDPGAEEVVEKRPFVGMSGKILRAYIKEFGLEDSASYVIYNIVQCRPPENKEPKPEIVENCREFLEKMIEITNPKLIVALGGLTAKWFGATGTVSKVRGKFIDWNGRKVFITFHPSYFLHGAR